MLESQVHSLGREDPLEKGMATHSGILVWRIPWTEEPGRLQSMGSQRIGHNWATHTHTFFFLPEISRWTSLSPQEKRHPAPVFTFGVEESKFPASNLPRDATTPPPAPPGRHANRPAAALLLASTPHAPPATSDRPPLPVPSPPARFLKRCFLTCPGPSPSFSHPPLPPWCWNPTPPELGYLYRRWPLWPPSLPSSAFTTLGVGSQSSSDLCSHSFLLPGTGCFLPL